MFPCKSLPPLRLLWLVLISAALCGFSRAAPARPNIIVILSDDMGFSDLGCYGSEIATPNLDALASGGLRFTQFYNTARCCPTRAALLTGLYPHQAGIGHMTQDQGYEGYRGDLNQNCRTIAEVLRPAGYRTYATGKWHVTKGVNAGKGGEEVKHNWPLQRGFDRFYGTIIGGGSYWDPAFLTRDNRQVSAFADPDYEPGEPYYYTDAITDHAVGFVKDHHRAHADAPFFLYVAYTAAHWPMHAREREIAKYRGKYSAGYEAIRAARYEKMLKLGLIGKNDTTLKTASGADPAGPDWEWDQRNMEVYAAMIDSMDQGIGKLVAELKATGQFENTMLCFMQDNGACAENIGRGGQGGPRGEKPSLPPMPAETLRTELTPKQTRDGFPVRQGKGVMAGAADTYVAYGQAWASVSNTPFREYKHWVHEGGISTPLIVHWPAGMAAERAGKWDATPGHLIDIMATCVDLGKAAYPSEVAGNPIKPLPGRSLAPRFAVEPAPAPARQLFWEHEGNRAVRDGEWKLVAKENQPWELYNISRDRSEQHDLADAQPERVKDLAAKWDHYAATSDVLPLGAWRGKKAAPVSAGPQRFAWKPGDPATSKKNLEIAGRPLKIEASFEAPVNARGVVVAQGGTRHGYAVYVAEGKLYFAVRRAGVLTEVSQPLAAGMHRVSATLDGNGRLTLNLDDSPAGDSSAPGTLLGQPADGLDIGRDDKGQVGNYGGDSVFTGAVKSVNIETGEVAK